MTRGGHRAIAILLAIVAVVLTGVVRAELTTDENAEARWRRARALYDADQCDAAIAAFTEILEKDASPQRAGLAITLSIDCLVLRKRFEAIAELGSKFCPDPRFVLDEQFVRTCQSIYTPPACELGCFAYSAAKRAFVCATETSTKGMVEKPSRTCAIVEVRDAHNRTLASATAPSTPDTPALRATLLGDGYATTLPSAKRLVYNKWERVARELELRIRFVPKRSSGALAAELRCIASARTQRLLIDGDASKTILDEKGAFKGTLKLWVSPDGNDATLLVAEAGGSIDYFFRQTIALALPMKLCVAR